MAGAFGGTVRVLLEEGELGSDAVELAQGIVGIGERLQGASAADRIPGGGDLGEFGVGVGDPRADFGEIVGVFLEAGFERAQGVLRLSQVTTGLAENLGDLVHGQRGKLGADRGPARVNARLEAIFSGLLRCRHANCRDMATSEQIQGREVRPEDIAWVRATIAAHPEWTRKALARALCAAWGWTDGRGRAKDFAARSLLLKLAARGEIVLPALRYRRPRQWA